MKRNPTLALLAAGLLSPFLASTGNAYVFETVWSTNQRFCPIYFHFNTEQTPKAKFPLTDGSLSYEDVAKKALIEWNSYMTGIILQPQERPTFAPKFGDKNSSFYFAYTDVDGFDMDSRTEFRTFRTLYIDKRIKESDTVFNANLKWNSYPGPVKSNPRDFYRTVLRATGATLGLVAPDLVGQSVPSIMNDKRPSILRSLTRDDAMAVQAAYSPSTKALPPVEGSDAPARSANTPSGIQSTSATLEGVIGPKGLETQYLFEYDTASDKYRNATAKKSLAAGTKNVAVSALIKDLKPDTKYYYRFKVAAGNTNYVSAQRNFRTAKPVLSLSKATAVKATTATLNGKANPKGTNVTVEFQYDTKSGGTFSKRIGAKKLTGANKTVTMTADIKNLSKGKKYYYRLAASANGKTIYSSVSSFATPKK